MRVRGSVRGALGAIGCLSLVVLLSVCSRDGASVTGPTTHSVPEVPFASLTTVPVTGNVLIGGGNIATCSGNDDEKTAGILDTVPGTVFTTGNAAYPSGTDSAYTNCFNPSTTWGRHKTRILPAAGDQDYLTANASGYYKYFGSAAGDPTKGYYSYDVGSWHVVALNSSLSMIAGSPQETWLRTDLSTNGKACTLAYWQLPLYSSGQSGSQDKARPLFKALYDYGADVVLNGKDRDYERFAPQDANGVADPINGVREFVVGTGGAGNSSSFRSTTLPNSEARYIAQSGLLK